MAEALARTHADLAEHLPLTAEYIAAHYFPDRPETIVPLAISLALLTESAETTALLAANVGGDADSVASIGGAIAGALRPETVNHGSLDVVATVNGEDLEAEALAVVARRG
jgi:ADP-ribosylglycohydrolase